MARVAITVCIVVETEDAVENVDTYVDRIEAAIDQLDDMSVLRLVNVEVVEE